MVENPLVTTLLLALAFAFGHYGWQSAVLRHGDIHREYTAVFRAVLFGLVLLLTLGALSTSGLVEVRF